MERRAPADGAEEVTVVEETAAEPARAGGEASPPGSRQAAAGPPHRPLVREMAAVHDNNNEPSKPVVPRRPEVAALPLPAGPPPRKPPRTFEHDAYVVAREARATTVAIRRGGSGPRPALARKPSDLDTRRRGCDETLYGTLSREHVYERLPDAKRPVSVTSSAGSPPGLRRNGAFKRLERPSLRCWDASSRAPPPPAPRSRHQVVQAVVQAMGLGWLCPAVDGSSADYPRPSPQVVQAMGGARPRPGVGPADRLFDALLVVALSAEADGSLEPCIISRYPPDVAPEADVAPFCFPDADRWQRAPDEWGRSAADGGAAYTLVVTDERGGRSYGYCRRLTADTGGEPVTLPIAYCLLSRHDAGAFYSQLLSAILEHHGTSEQHRLSVLEELYNQPFPAPGGSVSVLPVPAACPAGEAMEPASAGPVTLEPSLVRRPLDPRLDDGGLYQLVRRLGVDLFIKLFSSALLERKLVLCSSHLGVLSSSVAAVQAALCPFVWQHCLVPVVPSQLAELLAVPSPLIMGALPEARPLDHLAGQEDVICVDLDTASLVQCVGDESTILPRRLGRALVEALRLAAWLPGPEPDSASAAVLLAETLLRLFVEVCGHYRAHFVTQQDGQRLLQRDAFVEAAPTDDVREFLEWFTETAMFNAFIESCERHVETPAVSLFNRRVLEQHDELETSAHGLRKGTRQLSKALSGRLKRHLHT
ncbi:DENN domain-containing protein 2D-like [Pollicipes pollicipes]|uniref:DENN domain-containing protein 2D-like n=1 Tax=Pollicipes pollicipes TaxID=41117 RepID=UPI001884B49B|nr:DENN domain-containing protein 2D-like [Pollicipes pollicipes]